MADQDLTSAQRVMGNLIFPSVLGSALVWFVQGITLNFSKDGISLGTLETVLESEKLWVALWLILYFPAAFLLLSKKIEGYGGWLFLLDLLDSVLVFTIFYNLELVVTGVQSLPGAYWGIVGMAFVGICTHFYHIKRDPPQAEKTTRIGKIGVAVLIGLVAGILSFNWLSSSVARSAGVLSLFVLLLIYYLVYMNLFFENVTKKMTAINCFLRNYNTTTTPTENSKAKDLLTKVQSSGGEPNKPPQSAVIALPIQ